MKLADCWSIRKNPLKRILKSNTARVDNFFFFRFASPYDKVLMVLGAVFALGAGLCLPFMTIYLAHITRSLINNGWSDSTAGDTLCSNGNVTYNMSDQLAYDRLVNEVTYFIVHVIAFATAGFTCCCIYVYCFNTAAENQVSRLRDALFKAMLRQEIAWHDENKSINYTTRFPEDLREISEGIGEKIGMMIAAVSSYVFAVAVAFYYGWKFTLVMIGIAPTTSIAVALLTKIQAKFSGAERELKAEVGGIAQEVFGAIRTVLAFDGQENEIKRFEFHSKVAKKIAIKTGAITGCISAVCQGLQFFVFALGFWYGAGLVVDVCQPSVGYSSLDVIIVLFCVLGGTSRLSTVTPYLENFTRARNSAAFTYRIIDRVPPIDSLATTGLCLDHLRGHVSFKNVNFKYSTRPDASVLKGVTFEVRPRQTVALVGPSGSGKSTCIQLILRLYDPESGLISIDGHNLQDINVRWLRSQIGCVSQEPVLFSGSISDNIRHGKSNATQEEIEFAAQQANAEEFILKLTRKYDTVIGERGTQLSGGQKQRIAIARALVRNPSILLLDEATSALDHQSERLVQQALEQASQARTVVIVAHRLSTIRKADVIVVLKDGVVFEIGDHDSLIAQKGLYFNMISAQEKKMRRYNGQRNESEITNTGETSSLLVKQDDQQRNADLFPQKDVKHHKKAKKEKCHANLQPSFLQLTLKELLYIMAGLVASLFVGISVLTLSYLNGQVLNIFLPSLGDEGVDTREKVALKYCYMFIAAGLFFAAVAFLQSLFLTIAGEALVERLRNCAFSTIIKRDISWFDCAENKVGDLCSRIFTDTALVQSGTGLRMGLVFQAMTTTLICGVMAFYYHWKLGLLAIGIAPIMGVIIFWQSKITTAAVNIQRECSSEALSSEVIASIRTVASLGSEDHCHKTYAQSLKDPHNAIVRNIWRRALIHALTNSFAQYSYAVSLYLGSVLIPDGLPFEVVITMGHGLRYGLQAISNALEFSPNFFEAKLAAERILKLINHNSTEPKRADLKESVTCNQLDFENVSFRYPSHVGTSQTVRQLTFSVKPGRNIALVGCSGSGKSTCIQLILRFYDPDSGSIRVNSMVDARQLNIKSLRSNLGFVSQEPILFDRTIKENIAYGDNTREIQMDEIIEAARMANIHSFIQSLPNGYDTVVGNRGAQLSGGEKQRIAIARALVRKPKILLLDEATSALDNESEKVVQLALDAVRKGRTCITVAHRLSTVRNADCIVVLHKGTVHEQGTHKELLRMRGMYAKLLEAEV